jgi:hypothetical protein
MRKLFAASLFAVAGGFMAVAPVAVADTTLPPPDPDPCVCCVAPN